MTELYNTLGVERDADTADIKKAHRKAVARLHPDNQDTGDREGFEAAQKAFEILSDPEKRDRYDKTGDTETKADNRASQVHGIAMREFTAACQSCDLQYDDIIAKAKASIKGQINAANENIAMLQDNISDMTKARDRVRCKSGDNFLVTGMNSMIADSQRGIEQLQRQQDMLVEATALLDGFEYQVDERPKPTPHYTYQHQRDAMAYAMGPLGSGRGKPSQDDLLKQMMAELKRYKF